MGCRRDLLLLLGVELDAPVGLSAGLVGVRLDRHRLPKALGCQPLPVDAEINERVSDGNGLLRGQLLIYEVVALAVDVDFDPKSNDVRALDEQRCDIGEAGFRGWAKAVRLPEEGQRDLKGQRLGDERRDPLATGPVDLRRIVLGASIRVAVSIRVLFEPRTGVPEVGDAVLIVVEVRAAV